MGGAVFDPGAEQAIRILPLDAVRTPVLNEVAPGVTRLLVRVRGGPGYRFHGLPRSLTRLVVRVVHFIMQRKQLLGIRRRAESTRADTLVPADRSPTADKDAA